MWCAVLDFKSLSWASCLLLFISNHGGMFLGFGINITMRLVPKVSQQVICELSQTLTPSTIFLLFYLDATWRLLFWRTLVCVLSLGQAYRLWVWWRLLPRVNTYQTFDQGHRSSEYSTVMPLLLYLIFLVESNIWCCVKLTTTSSTTDLPRWVVLSFPSWLSSFSLWILKVTRLWVPFGWRYSPLSLAWKHFLTIVLGVSSLGECN